MNPLPQNIRNPDDPFHSAWYSINWAQHHIRELNRLVGEFLNSKPYTEIMEIDPNTGDEIYKVKLIKKLPWECVGHLTDATNNLRAALDQTIFALKKTFTYFPIGNSEEEFDRMLPGKGFPDEIANIIRGFQPYRGGNNSIWALNKLCNTNKHGVLGFMASAGSEIRVGSMSGHRMSIGPPKWDRTKNEMEVARVSPGTKYSDLVVGIYVIIYDIETIERRSVQDVMKSFFYTVRDIVTALETESKKLGLVST